jgi:hypothetical protein
VLATGQFVETLHHGSIFTGLRLKAFRWQQSSSRILRFAGDLLSCPFCLSHWAAVLMVTLAFASAWDIMLAAPVYWLAAVRAANLLNDLTHEWCRSPAADVFEPPRDNDEDKAEVVAEESICLPT